MIEKIIIPFGEECYTCQSLNFHKIIIENVHYHFVTLKNNRIN